MTHEKWAINESVLQFHRAIFIGLHSVLLVVGALLLQKPQFIWPLVGLGLLSVYMIWQMWFPIVRSRARLVDYYKFRSNPNHADAFKGITEKDYVNATETRDRINAEIKIQNWRQTRRKLDLGLPFVFTAIWCILVFSAFLT